MARPVKGGDEQDVLTGWRRAYCWTQRAGACKRVKRRANRRERREARVIIEQDAPPPPVVFDAHDLAVIGMYEEAEAIEGECRHGCNGDCIVLGTGSDVCDFLCHPGLACDDGAGSFAQYGSEEK